MNNSPDDGRFSETHGVFTSGNTQLRRTYYAWGAMKQRCCNPDNPNYDDYGGRGITVCRRWLHPENGFQNFLDDMGVKPAGTELDRRNNSRGYSPVNCRWVTAKVNGNNKRNNVRVTHNGRTKTVAQWAEQLGLSYETFRWRVKQGWTGARLFQPARPRS